MYVCIYVCMFVSFIYVDCWLFFFDGLWLSAVGCWLSVSTVVRSRLLIFGIDCHSKSVVDFGVDSCSLSFVVVVGVGRLLIVGVDCRGYFVCRRNWRIEVSKFHQYSIYACPKCTNILYCSLLLYNTGIWAVAYIDCGTAPIKILNICYFPPFFPKRLRDFSKNIFLKHSTKEATEYYRSS